MADQHRLVLDIHGESVNMTEWQSMADRYMSELVLDDYVDAVNTIRSHKNANPLGDGIFYRSTYLVPPGSETQKAFLRNHGGVPPPIPTKYIPPPREMRGEWSASAPQAFRAASNEEIPTCDWMAVGAPYHDSVVNKWLTLDTTWETYNKRELDGEGLSAYARGGFQTLKSLQNTFVYPPHWGPYAVICALIEEKRFIRNFAGVFYLRPAYEWKKGVCGPRAIDLIGDPFLKDALPEDPRLHVILAGQFFAQSRADDLGIDFSKGRCCTPVLGKRFEVREGKKELDLLIRLQSVAPRFFFGLPKTLKSLGVDAGIPIQLPNFEKTMIKSVYDLMMKKYLLYMRNKDENQATDPTIRTSAPDEASATERTMIRDKTFLRMKKILDPLPLDIGNIKPQKVPSAPLPGTGTTPTVNATPKAATPWLQPMAPSAPLKAEHVPVVEAWKAGPTNVPVLGGTNLETEGLDLAAAQTRFLPTAELKLGKERKNAKLVEEQAELDKQRTLLVDSLKGLVQATRLSTETLNSGAAKMRATFHDLPGAGSSSRDAAATSTSRRREASAPNPRMKSRSPSRTGRARSQSRSKSKERPRSASRGPAPFQPAESRSRAEQGTGTYKGPKFYSSEFNVFTKHLYNSRENIPLFMAGTTAAARSLKTSRDPNPRDHHEFGTFGSTMDIPLINEDLVEKFCRYLAGTLGTELSDLDDGIDPLTFCRREFSTCATDLQYATVVEKSQDVDGIFRDLLHPPPGIGATDAEKENYVAKIRATYRVKTSRTISAINTALQYKLNHRLYDLRWEWRYVSDMGPIRKLFKAEPDTILNMNIEVGVLAPGHEKEDVFASKSRIEERTLSATVASHLSLITQWHSRMAGMQSVPVVADIAREKKPEAKDRKHVLATFGGIEVHTSQYGAGASQELQPDPNGGLPFQVFWVGFLWHKNAHGPFFGLFIPEKGNREAVKIADDVHRWGQDSMRTPALQPRMRIETKLRPWKVPASMTRLLEYAFGPLLTADAKLSPEGDPYQLAATSEKHIAEVGFRNKGFSRTTAPGVPMTIPWLAWAACADTLDDLPEGDRPVFLFMLETFLESHWCYEARTNGPSDRYKRNMRWDKAVWEFDYADPPVMERSMQYATADRLKKLSNPCTCCVAVPVCLIAASKNGPSFLKNIRKFYTVEANPPGGDLLEIKPKSAFRHGPNSAVLYDALLASVPVSWPWFDERLRDEASSEPAQTTNIAPSNTGDTEDGDDSISFISSQDTTFPGRIYDNWEAQYVNDAADALSYLEAYVEESDAAIQYGQAVIKTLSKRNRYGGPGWATVKVPIIWEDLIAYNAKLIPLEPPRPQTAVKYIDQRIIASGFPVREFSRKPNVEMGQDTSLSANRPWFVNMNRPMVDVMSLVHAFWEVIGYVSSLEFEGQNAEQHEEKRKGLIERIQTTVKHPMTLHGLKTVFFDSSKEYFLRYRNFTQDDNGTAPPEELKEVFKFATDWKCEEAFNRYSYHSKFNADKVTEKEMIIGPSIVCTGPNLEPGKSKDSCNCTCGTKIAFFPGLKMLDELWKLYSQTHDTQLKFISGAISDILDHMETIQHANAVYTRTYFTSMFARDCTTAVEASAYQERVASIAWLILNAKKFKLPMAEIVPRINAAEFWQKYSFVGIPFGNTRLPPPTIDEVDHYTEHYKSMFGFEIPSIYTVYKRGAPKVNANDLFG